jgi:epoxyqueuosine reductase
MGSTITHLIKTEAARLGFDLCGICRVEELKENKNYLDKWIEEGKNAEMRFFTRNKEIRANPSVLMDGAKSVISLLINYFPEKKQNENSFYKISKYAHGNDYHVVIRKKLDSLIQYIKDNSKGAKAEGFVDSTPIFEKAWAQKCGLGNIGKNTLLINPVFGTFCFVSEIFTDLELEYDACLNFDPCKNCHACTNACPSHALDEEGHLNASKCISYISIESKTLSLSDFSEKWIYGCDICQDVCPWNKKAKTTNEQLFKGNQAMLELKKEDLENLTEEKFTALFENSAVKRIGYEKLMKNIRAIIK